jgi:hypothetical protein
MTAIQPPPLPVRVRPLRDEAADSYLRRLATANHLPFSYLRRYLAVPRGSYGPLSHALLATLSGRDTAAILRAFPEFTPPRPRPDRPRSYSRKEIEQNRAAAREKYAVIRYDARHGLSQRDIMTGHNIGRRTIAQALASPEPPPRKKIPREPTALGGLHAIIDTLIQEDPRIGTAAIWRHLADDHGVTVAYYTLRAYVARQRAAIEEPGKKN